MTFSFTGCNGSPEASDRFFRLQRGMPEMRGKEMSYEFEQDVAALDAAVEQETMTEAEPKDPVRCRYRL
jgi:hypothetical protein